ncbi:TetR/AcrR family transcriptional regulator [Flexivirga sp. ID2601S]|uniref:TetR/AcrR family transcriptional regulator n=1 Tax=Flexivirga aerilata TaxID=1656889 RepID=A0A849ALE5_9MICO|nr:TetR family transcriptional regulator C-terminal domain-containing protein [Flexivirga aerilata]NNG41169.1 TetR/AcrR family transcriptional regulator [Flexivirga aerilata]
MPKVVDHEERRAEIADGVWRVIRRDGYAALSVRTVAAETGRSVGAVRHYFEGQDALVAFAMQTLADRVGERVRRLGADATDLPGLVRLLETVLPLDAARRAESEVWLALTMAARTDESLGAVWRQVHTRLRGLMESCVLTVQQVYGVDLDVATETTRLHALTDGLALHGTLEPRLGARRIRAALTAHLQQLAGSPAAAVDD